MAFSISDGFFHIGCLFPSDMVGRNNEWSAKIMNGGQTCSGRSGKRKRPSAAWSLRRFPRKPQGLGLFPGRPECPSLRIFPRREKSWAIPRLGNRSPGNSQAMRTFPSKAFFPRFWESRPQTAQHALREIAQKFPDPAFD